jgi:hypothetical protein
MTPHRSTQPLTPAQVRTLPARIHQLSARLDCAPLTRREAKRLDRARAILAVAYLRAQLWSQP